MNGVNEIPVLRDTPILGEITGARWHSAREGACMTGLHARMHVLVCATGEVSAAGSYGRADVCVCVCVWCGGLGCQVKAVPAALELHPSSREVVCNTRG